MRWLRNLLRGYSEADVVSMTEKLRISRARGPGMITWLSHREMAALRNSSAEDLLMVEQRTDEFLTRTAQ